MDEFLRVISVATGTVSFIALFRPLPRIGLPTRKRAACVWAASWVLLFLSAGIGQHRFTQQKSDLGETAQSITIPAVDQPQKATAKAEKADSDKDCPDTSTQSLSESDLQKLQEPLIAQRNKIWIRMEALHLGENTPVENQEKINTLGEEANKLTHQIRCLSEKIVKARNHAQAQAKRQSQAQAKRQFSQWDGSHRKLVSEIKQKMHDPKSFEHVDTRFWLMNHNTTLRVWMKYRGKNVFGATVTETVKADFDMNGNFVRFLE